MNIIELARKAGFKQRHNSNVEWWMLTEHIQAFAAAVIKAHEAKLIAGAGEPAGYAVPTFNFDNSVIQTVQYAGTEPLYTASQVAATVAKANAEVEQLRVQLAGCGVAAMQNTESSKSQRAVKGDYGYSESYADVCRAVDREIEHRERVAELEAEIAGWKADQKENMQIQVDQHQRITTLESTLKVALEALEPHRSKAIRWYSPEDHAIAKIKEVLHD